MKYDFIDKPINWPEFSPEFYREIDQRFLRSVKVAFPWESIPFDNFIDFEKLTSQAVLEIGVGMGTHAEILSTHASSYTGIDLTEYAVNATRRRMEIFGRSGMVRQMDAECLEYPDASFDFVWSWGVIHHSANTRKILEQIYRVLKPGGMLTFMVYHQSVWNTFGRGLLYYGFLKGGIFRGKNMHQLIQDNTDGALARYYTLSDLKEELDGKFLIKKATFLGNKMQLLPMKYGPWKEKISGLISDDLGRRITNRPFFAYMLVANCIRID
ncbi:MAG: class I SAM-dependent methyltransferase [Deltaproteobacteria bacterium]|nr:class I SAM-dependent methyltransferase [Deltaproteobacteria bacterium]